jgi:hypothetical protein
MIFERYYSYIKDYQYRGGDGFTENVYNPAMKSTGEIPDLIGESEDFTPNLHQGTRRGTNVYR